MANRYWVGGAGSWTSSATANWSASSGGAAGASAPTSADSVFFDSNSGSGAVAFSAGNCLDCNILSGTSVTFSSGTSFINVYGNWTNTANINTGSGQTVFFLATGSVNLQPQTGTIDKVYFNGTGGVYNLVSNMTVTTQITLSRGTIAPGSYSLYAGYFYVPGTAANGITFTGSTPGIYLTGDNTTVLLYYYNNTTLTGNVYFRLSNNSTTGTRTIITNASATGGSAVSVQVDAGSDTIAVRGTSGTYSRINSFTTNSGSFSGTVDIAYSVEVFGNFALKSGNTFNNSGSTAPIKMKGTGGGNAFNTNGVSLGSTPVYFDGVGGSWTFYGASVYTTNTMYLVNGSVDTNGVSVTINDFSSTGTGTRSLTLGSSSVTLNGYGTVWNITGSGITLSAASSSIYTAGSLTAKTFTTPSTLSYGQVINTGYSNLTLGAATYRYVGASGSGLGTIIYFTAGATTYITEQLAGGTGSGANLIYYKSSSSGTQATISKSSGTVSVSYASIQDLNATGGATFYALTSNGNINAGGNTGWIFNQGAGNFLGFF